MSELHEEPDGQLEVKVNFIETESGENLQHPEEEVLNQNVTQIGTLEQTVNKEKDTAALQEIKVEIRTSSADHRSTTPNHNDVRTRDHQAVKSLNDAINSTATGGFVTVVS